MTVLAETERERRRCEETTYTTRARCSKAIVGVCSCGMRLCATHLGTHEQNMGHEQITGDTPE